MVNWIVVNYLAENIKKGRRLSELKRRLRRQGYSKKEIEEALRYLERIEGVPRSAYGPKKIPIYARGNFLIILIIVVIVLSGLSLALLAILSLSGGDIFGGDKYEVCKEKWQCGNWGPFECPGTGIQTRSCVDLNKCGTDKYIPDTVRKCSAPCAEVWSCEGWSNCINGTQTRICRDLNTCGTRENKPPTNQSCIVECYENWTCSIWSLCINETQARNCTDLNACGTTSYKPLALQNC